MCSPAVFGRTSIEYAHAPVEIVAPVAVSLERTGCSPEPILLSQENGNDGSEVIRPYEGKILLVARGKCTFEEKALYAQSAGAAGVVVINTEVLR